MGRLPRRTSLAQANDQLARLGPAILEQTLPAGYRPDMATRFREMRLEAVDGRAGVSPLRSRYERPLWVLMNHRGERPADCRNEPRAGGDARAVRAELR